MSREQRRCTIVVITRPHAPRMLRLSSNREPIEPASRRRPPAGEDGRDSPHPCAIHGSARAAERLDSTALGRRSLIRMRPLVRVQPGPRMGTVTSRNAGHCALRRPPNWVGPVRDEVLRALALQSRGNASEQPLCGSTVVDMPWIVGCTAVSEPIPRGFPRSEASRCGPTGRSLSPTTSMRSRRCRTREPGGCRWRQGCWAPSSCRSMGRRD